MFQLHAAELRSITSICVVEDTSKCPLGYTPVSISNFNGLRGCLYWLLIMFGIVSDCEDT